MPCVIWITGLSAAGKTTLAHLVLQALLARDYRARILDGDVARQEIPIKLGYSAWDRRLNVDRLIGCSASWFDSGLAPIVAATSPFREGRVKARSIFPEGRFFEVHVNTPLEVCEQRDPKGLYAAARAGQIENMVGLDIPYEEPENPELRLDGATLTPEEMADRVMAMLEEAGVT